MPTPLRQFARDRAGRRCEYCHFSEANLPLWPFHLDHIVAKQHGGSDDASNVAWSCHRCNLRKGTNLSAVDPDTGQVVRLFHPRTDDWRDHFKASAGRITGLTETGRATAWLFEMNTDDRVYLRRVLKGTFE